MTIYIEEVKDEIESMCEDAHDELRLMEAMINAYDNYDLEDNGSIRRQIGKVKRLYDVMIFSNKEELEHIERAKAEGKDHYESRYEGPIPVTELTYIVEFTMGKIKELVRRLIKSASRLGNYIDVDTMAWIVELKNMYCKEETGLETTMEL